MNIVCFHNPDEDNGYLSNWYPSPFTVDGVAFSSMEQFMMYRKAICFGDEAVAAQILSTSDVAKIKSLGRQVSNYDESMWNGIRQIVVCEGLLAKFSQNDELKAKLKATGNAVLAECAVKDCIWGIGLSMKDPDRLNKAKWNGQNLLGYALMMVRERLQQDYSWEQRKLGELGTITTGSTPSTAIPDYYSDDGIVWVTPTDICENITFESTRKLSDLGQQVGRVVPKNTILVTCIASIGKNTMLGSTGSFNQQINGLTPNENECDPYFLLTESALWSAKMKSSAAAGTMQIVNRTEFSELKTWLPSLIEQKAISDFFRQLDYLITLHQRELEKLQNIKKSMLEKMFVQEEKKNGKNNFISRYS